MEYTLLEELIQKKQEKFQDISDKIWSYAEPGYKEIKSSYLQQQAMEEEGFTIEKNLGGIETAFSASFGSGKPVIGFLGEFDALPGLSQEADATCEQPLAGGYGHGCGHNLLGTACMQAAVAVKDYLLQNQMSGTVIYYGCPAEEGGAGKAFMLREGSFDNCDVCVAWHPFSITSGSTSTLANARVYYNFKGVSSHAAASPHLGRSALDSVELMNVGVNYLREHIIPEARIHYAITDAGGNAPNVVQANAQVLYSIRTPRNDQLSELMERVNNIAKGAAMMCGTTVDIQVVSGYADIIQNKTLDQLAFKHIRDVYPLKYTEEEIQYANAFYDVGQKTESLTYQELAKRSLGEKGEGLFKGPLADGVFPPSPQKTGSTDVGDISWNIPTTWFAGNCFALGTSAHTWLAVAQGKSSIAHKGMTAAATVMARCAVDILNEPEIVQQAKKDLEKALNGSKYQSIIPRDVKPGMIE
ncbi:MAG: M20 family metallopeptidase [Tissierellaceae bacterium]